MKKTRIAIVMVLILSMLMGTTAFAAGKTASKTTKGVTVLNAMSSNDIDDKMYIIVEVQNLNGIDCFVSMDAYSTANDGTIIEESSSDVIYLEAGASYALVATFDSKAASKAPSFDYDLIVDTDVDNYDIEPASDDVDAKFSDNGKGTVTVYAKNTSSDIIDGEGIVIFYKNDQIVDFERLYLSHTKDNLMYPGSSTTEYVYTNSDYDASTLYITAVK